MLSQPVVFELQNTNMELIEKHPKTRTQQVNFRLTEKELKQLDRFVARKNWTRTKAIRWMIANLPLAKQEAK